MKIFNFMKIDQLWSKIASLDNDAKIVSNVFLNWLKETMP